MKKFKSNSIVLTVSAVFLLMTNFSASCFAAQLEGAYKSAKRYNIGGQLTGLINADPDGIGPLGFPASRNNFNDRGLLESIEVGFLEDWQDENISAYDWNGFSIHREQLFTYDMYGRKLTELTIAVNQTNADEQVLTQYSYDSLSRVVCKAVRMNVATFSQNISNAENADSACYVGTEGDFGPDRITKYVYHHDYNVIVKELRAVDTDIEQVYAQYSYNSLKLKTSVTDANGNYTKMEYDGFGRLEYMYFPNEAVVGAGSENRNDFEKYSYDNNGNRKSLKKRDGKIINYVYDNLGRVTQKKIPSSTTLDVFYAYDLRGLELNAKFDTNGNGQLDTTDRGITREFYGFGEIKSESNNSSGVNYTTTYEYDANSNRISLKYPDNLAFTYHYDGLDRLEYIKDNSGSALATQVFNNFGQTQNLNRANSANSTVEYDDIGRVNKLQHNLADTAYDVIFGYSYSPANQMTSLDTSNGFYQYSGVGPTESFTVNGLNQYTVVGSNGFGYDDNGNLTADGSSAYYYDVENRLTSITGAKAATFKYDPVGRLYEYTAGGSTKRFVYDGDALIAEYSTSNNMLNRYVHGVGSDVPLLSYSGTSTTSTNRQYVHANHQGSIIAQSNSTGALAFSNTYDEYGIPATSNHGRFGYTGQLYLKEIEFYYYKARIYHPKLGRFLQTDPVGYEDQMNLYAYVGNDPVNMIDPTGKTGIDSRLDLRVKRLVSGEISESQYRAENMAEAYGGIGAVSLFIPGPEDVVIVAGISKFGRGAESAINGVKLEKQLASESQLTQLAKGGGEVLSQPAKQSKRISEQYGVEASNVQKVSSTSHTAKDGTKLETHAFRDASTNKVIEPKTMTCVGSRIKVSSC